MSDEMKACPAGHNFSRVIGGPGAASGPKYWAGCDYCNWRAWGDTEAEAIAAWNTRAAIEATTVKGDGLVERLTGEWSGVCSLLINLAQLCDAWKAGEPETWTQWDQEQRDHITRVLEARDTARQTLSQGTDNWLGDVVDRAKVAADAGPTPMKSGRVRHRGTDNVSPHHPPEGE